MNLLIVEDDTMLRNWLSMLLNSLTGYQLQIHEACDGLEALEICEKFPIDLVITDIKMPRMDGLQLIQCLQERYPRIRTAVLSSYDDFSFVKIALQYGSLDYILKAEMTVKDLSQLLDKVQNDFRVEHSLASGISPDYRKISAAQKAMAELFDVNVPAISKHLSNIFEEGELFKEATVSKMEIVQMEGNRKVKREPEFYNLDAIIAVGYRVNSKKATRFRQWATKTLKDYITKGFVLNDDMLKNGKLFGKDYFAVTGKTAAELVYERVNAEKPAMGLTTWKDAPDGKILKRDISVAKNYLNEKELSRLNRLVTMFIDYAELMAEDEVLMSMQDWVEQTNQFLRNNRREVLEGKGKVSHDMAMKKAEKEYEIFRVKQDQEYVSEFDREVERYLKGE